MLTYTSVFEEYSFIKVEDFMHVLPHIFVH